MGKKKKGSRAKRDRPVEISKMKLILFYQIHRFPKSPLIHLLRKTNKEEWRNPLLYTGDNEEDENRDWVNGLIFSCISNVDDTARFVCHILTSVDLFRPLLSPYIGNILFGPCNICVCLPTLKSYQGEIVACDLHYNIAVVKIESDVFLPTATLTSFIDSVSVSPLAVFEASAPPTQHPYHSKILPGDELIAIFHCSPIVSDVIVCSGKYSVDYTKFGLNCDELLRINCRVRQSGGPIINCEGDVLGVAFDAKDFTAFLPTNIFLKWKICRPFLRIQVANLFTKSTGFLEPLVHDFNISDGVVVEEVADGSPAASANMRQHDVICQCDGRPVKSFLEFYELLWDKIGEVIEVKGIRDGSHFIWELEIKAMKTSVLPEIFVKNDAITKKSTKNKAKERSEILKVGGSISSEAKTRKTKGKKKRKRKNVIKLSFFNVIRHFK
ncbi:hypothetical protein LIER_37525 [Lithospermum erythrorhizon]|uniref:PDZ domain-containing protein n=1 Tax=Lithospermum erythrorhizon TaxID=34254 RepID=A0AAV3PLN8_LITER